MCFIIAVISLFFFYILIDRVLVLVNSLYSNYNYYLNNYYVIHVGTPVTYKYLQIVTNNILYNIEKYLLSTSKN